VVPADAIEGVSPFSDLNSFAPVRRPVSAPPARGALA